MPFALRYRMAYDHRLVREVRRVMMRTIFAFLRRRARARGLAEPEGGAVAFVQRFGSALNLNPHLHVLVLDGVYARPAPDGPRLFHRLPDPTEAEISTLLSALRARLSRRLRRLGIPPLDDETAAEAPLPFASESLGATYAAAVQDRDASGAPVSRLGRDPDAPFQPPAKPPRAPRIPRQPRLPPRSTPRLDPTPALRYSGRQARTALVCPIRPPAERHEAMPTATRNRSEERPVYHRVLRQMRELVRTSRYVMTVHGHEEMQADQLTIFDVEHCILTGQIVARQKDARTGDWKYLVEGQTLGHERGVIVTKLGPTGKLVIITVYALRR